MPGINPTRAEVVPRDEALATTRIATCLAGMMGGLVGHSLSDSDCPVPTFRHFPAPNVDIGAIRGDAPAARQILGWVRRRRTRCMLAHLSVDEPLPQLTVDTYLWDGGVAVFDGLRLFTTGARRWWLVGHPQDPLLLRLCTRGPVPTLVRPYSDEAGMLEGLALATELLASQLAAAGRSNWP